MPDVRFFIARSIGLRRQHGTAGHPLPGPSLPPACAHYQGRSETASRLAQNRCRAEQMQRNGLYLHGAFRLTSYEFSSLQRDLRLDHHRGCDWRPRPPIDDALDLQ